MNRNHLLIDIVTDYYVILTFKFDGVSTWIHISQRLWKGRLRHSDEEAAAESIYLPQTQRTILLHVLFSHWICCSCHWNYLISPLSSPGPLFLPLGITLLSLYCLLYIKWSENLQYWAKWTGLCGWLDSSLFIETVEIRWIHPLPAFMDTQTPKSNVVRSQRHHCWMRSVLWLHSTCLTDAWNSKCSADDWQPDNNSLNTKNNLKVETKNIYSSTSNCEILFKLLLL